MNHGRAAIGGVVAAAAISGLGLLARAMGVALDLEVLLGSALLGRVDSTAWAVGIAIHLTLGGIFGMIYAFLFRAAEHSHASPATVGASIASIHAVVAGVVLAALPAVHPLVPKALPAPGMFFSNQGLLPAIVFVALHLVFGALVGGFHAYGHARRMAPSL